MLNENKKDIAVICPTRDRPQNAIDAYESWMANNAGYSDFYVVCDSDQGELYEGPYKRIVAPKTGRRGMTDPVNYAAMILSKEYNYIMFIGDDHRFRTSDWDRQFLEAYASMGGSGFIYGNDLLQGAALPTACSMSSNYIQKLGYMVYPELIHLYIDNYWLSLGRALGKITYLGNVIIEHMHFCNGKAPHDAAYAAVNNGHIISTDQSTYSRIDINNEVRKLA